MNSEASGWKSYNYYSGTGSSNDGQMKTSDYMKYCDVTYNGNKYRGVTFSTYRPYYTKDTSTTSTGITYQDDNGYTYGNVYWFKYEPLRWRILDASTGLVMCETIIDSQPYNNYIISSGTDGLGLTACWGNSALTYYANNYAKSSIREWLNNDFYATAFTQTQQSDIKTTTLNNDGYYTLTERTGYEEFDAPSTSDKIFLLSFNEVNNRNYFSNSADLQLKGSDYAKCQGLYLPSDSNSDCSSWRLRSPSYRSDGACFIGRVGGTGNYCNTGSTDIGIVPALTLNLSSLGS